MRRWIGCESSSPSFSSPQIPSSTRELTPFFAFWTASRSEALKLDRPLGP
jgi:hypothetical protein